MTTPLAIGRCGAMMALALTLGMRLQAQSTTAAWPRYHGSDNTNRSTETGLLKRWPAEGPTLLWRATGLGKGYSSVAVVDGRIYTAGMTDKQTAVIALNLDGKEVWRQINGQSWETDKAYAKAYAGSRGTPTYAGHRVYHVADMGSLTAFDASTGAKVWNVDLLARFEGDMPKYGLSESVLVKGDRLFCSPAGRRAFVACLSIVDGSTIWVNKDIPGALGYASLSLVEEGGTEQIMGVSSEVVYGVNADTGALLWTVPHANARENNATNPILYRGHVFASTGYGKGSALFRIEQDADGFRTRPVWSSKLMDNHHGGVVLVGDHLYGSGHEEKGWFCLEFLTGKEAWRLDGKGSLTYADGMLYLLDERGTMSLVEANPAAARILSSFDLPKGGQGPYWAHPVVCGGRLYVRHADTLFAYRTAGQE